MYELEGAPVRILLEEVDKKYNDLVAFVAGAIKVGGPLAVNKLTVQNLMEGGNLVLDVEETSEHYIMTIRRVQ